MLDNIGSIIGIQDTELVKKLVGLFVLILVLSLCSCSSSIYSIYDNYYNYQEQKQIQEQIQEQQVVFKKKYKKSKDIGKIFIRNI